MWTSLKHPSEDVKSNTIWSNIKRLPYYEQSHISAIQNCSTVLISKITQTICKLKVKKDEAVPHHESV
jgi:hypothetical protein